MMIIMIIINKVIKHFVSESLTRSCMLNFLITLNITNLSAGRIHGKDFEFCKHFLTEPTAV